MPTVIESEAYLQALLTTLRQAHALEFPYDGPDPDETPAHPEALEGRAGAEGGAGFAGQTGQLSPYMLGYLNVIADDDVRGEWMGRLNEAGVLENERVQDAVRMLNEAQGEGALEAWGELIRQIHGTVYAGLYHQLDMLRPPKELRRFHDKLKQNAKDYARLATARGDFAPAYKPFLRDQTAWPRAKDLIEELRKLREREDEWGSWVRGNLGEFRALA